MLGLEQPVDEHDEPAGRIRDVLGHARDAAALAQRHRRLERGALGLELVAVQPVEHGERDRAAARARELPGRERGAGRAAGQRGRARDGGVGGRGDRVVRGAGGRGGRADGPEDAIGDRRVHRADPARAEGGLPAERAGERLDLAGHAVTLSGSADRPTRARCSAA